MESKLLINIFIFLAAACVVVPLASRFKLGSVLGYLIVGVLIGPFALGLIDQPERIMGFAEFGVIMMLFLIGLELEPDTLWRLRRSIIGMGGLQVVVTSVAIMLIGVAMGHDWQTTLAVGMALSLSSTALVMQMLQEKKLLHTNVGQTSFSVLLFQDIAVIFILILLPFLAASLGVPESRIANEAGHADGLLAGAPAWMQAGAVVLVLGTMVMAARFILPKLFHAVAKTNLRELFTATSLALVVGTTVLMEMVGVSPALGAFIGGVILANSEYKRTIETDIEPFKGLLLGLFFISVGMGMNFDVLLDNPFGLMAAVLGLIAVKAVVIMALAKWFGFSGEENLGLALGLAQGGEFAFVLFQMIYGLRIIGGEMYRSLMLIVAISIACTPLIMELYARYIVPRFLTVLPDRKFDEINERNSVIIAGFGRYGQVIGRFLRHQGVGITVLENNPDQIELVRKFGSTAYFGDATRLDLLRGAGAAQARVLVVAVDGAEDALNIVRMAKQYFPNLKIYARARNRRHAYELDKAGADHFRRETFESSLNMAREVMIALGFKPADMERKAKKFMAHDVMTLKKSFEFFDNEPELVNMSKLSAEELERILREDVADPEKINTNLR
ncbi:monovalent cation:proton antiporter-2 (CPA2) family protein [Asticcacaulis endophyticus]|uniref:Potassium transporter n=1 Tax=Asticcacaulis endophyticus TaxID=1395890 RepID=A0A918Q8D5_9CAUL|nr:monovalent cation:proton antiporter-2 (CPA2) family protein [Asticcacaulis endophyticus]GGZ36198.1 potassium transporter [Asticcacaulis endophyticus]